MFRLLGFNRSRGSPLKTSDLSHTDEDSHSVSSSVDDGHRPPSYITHSFQQKFQTDHPASAEMENFSSFMLKAANVLTPEINEKKQDSNWWEIEDDDDTSVDDQEDLSASSPINNANIHHDVANTEDSGEEDDDNSLNDTEKGLLYTSNVFSERTLGDIGRTTAALGLSSPERSDLPVINFAPRFEESRGDDDEHVPRSDFDASFRQFAVGAAFSTPQNAKVDTCFSTVHIMSPEDFDTLEEATIKEKRLELNQKKQASQSSKLSSMVHSMNPQLFANQKEEARRSDESLRNNSVSSSKMGSSVSTDQETVLSVEQYTIKQKGNRFNEVRKKLASSFRSKSNKSRVTYSLSKGKNGMSKQDRAYATSLLPAKPLLSKRQQRQTSTASIPRLIRQRGDQPLSILLLSPALKIFEIVLVDFLRETTVGEALSRARVAANDEALSEQKYTSLCNRKQEIAAPMLPVSLLVEKFKRRKNGGKLTEEEMRQAMEARLLVAVPVGSTASDCQLIRRVLWKNPRIQRWWKKANPFQHPDKRRNTDGDDGDLVVQDDKKMPAVTPAVPSKKERRNRSHQPKVRYEKFSDDHS